jgi:hypothetical protein
LLRIALTDLSSAIEAVRLRVADDGLFCFMALDPLKTLSLA